MSRLKKWKIKTSLDEQSIIRQHMKPVQVSFWDLPGLIKSLAGMGIPTESHRLQFLSLLFLPLVLMAMTVLGAAFSQTRSRRQFSFIKHFGFGIITCFAVYFAIQIMNAIGQNGAISPIFAIGLPPAIVLFFSATAIARHDNI